MKEDDRTDDSSSGSSGWEDFGVDEARVALDFYRGAIGMQEDSDDLSAADALTEATPVTDNRREAVIKRRPCYPRRGARHLGICMGLMVVSMTTIVVIVLTTDVGRSLFPVGGEKATGSEAESLSSEGSMADVEIPNSYRNLVDTGATSSSPALPLVWVLPGSGGILERVFGGCLGLVGAGGSEVELSLGSNESLSILNVDEYAYVNVDTNTRDGINMAVQKGLLKSGMADVIYSPLARDAAAMFTPENPGRFVTMFHDPIQRVAAVYDSARLSDPTFSNQSLLEFLEEGGGEHHDWMTRTLCGNTTGHLHEGCLDAAKAVLEKKCVIGLTSDFETSLSRIVRHLGIRSEESEEYKECVRQKKEEAVATFWSPAVKENSKEWRVLSRWNRNDLALYEYAKELFERQSSPL